jgi:uncharacterized protein YjiK
MVFDLVSVKTLRMKLILTIVVLCSLIALYYLHAYDKISWFEGFPVVSDEQEGKKKKKEKKQDEQTPEINASSVSIKKQWDLPTKLKEISSLTYLDNERFACNEDETGTIYIYNTTTKAIENEIAFAGPGDYEGIALVDKVAYVVRSDGKLLEVNNIESKKPVVKEYATPLKAKQNVEGLCFDKKNNRLLLAIKDKDAGGDDYKGIYAFDIGTKALAENPVYKIDLNDPAFSQENGKKKKAVIQPSAISVNPLNGDLYVTDGPGSRLLVMDGQGKIKSYISLGAKSFPQPEGITFNPQGDVFISNEGTKNSGNILQVSLPEAK